MSKILFILAHPNIESSIGNKTILEKFKSLNPDAEIDELYKLLLVVFKYLYIPISKLMSKRSKKN